MRFLIVDQIDNNSLENHIFIPEDEQEHPKS